MAVVSIHRNTGWWSTKKLIWKENANLGKEMPTEHRHEGRCGQYTCLSGPKKMANFSHKSWVDSVFLILITCTIWYSCKWYQTTGNIFVNIGVMSTSIDKIVKISGSLAIFKILENTENSLTKVELSHQKHLPNPPIQLHLQIWQIFGSVGKLRLKMARKHKFGECSLPAHFLAACWFPIGSSTGGYRWRVPPFHQIR